jgi:hypothetical protein
MLVIAYYCVQLFGPINGLGITGFVWLLGVVILDDAVRRREMKKFDAAMAALRERNTA